MFDIFIR